MESIGQFKSFNNIQINDRYLKCNGCRKILRDRIFLHSDEKHYCDECTGSNGGGVRNRGMEDILSNCYYECPNGQCGLWLKWADMEHHSLTCIHRAIKCILCKETPQLHAFHEHLTKYHANVCSRHEIAEPLLSIDMMKTSENRKYLLVDYKTHTFLITIQMEVDNVSFNIAKSWYPKDPEEKSFDVQFTCNDRTTSIQGELSTIEELLEDRCEQVTMYAKNWQCAAVRVKFSNGDEVSQIAECPICLNTLTSQVTVCVNLHPVCSNCSNKLQTCAICRQPMNATKLKLYHIMPNLRMPCTHAIEGCLKVLTSADDVEAHEKVCKHRPVPCPHQQCNLQVPVISMIDHFRVKHVTGSFLNPYRTRRSFKEFCIVDDQLFEMSCTSVVNNSYKCKVDVKWFDCFNTNSMKQDENYEYKIFTLWNEYTTRGICGTSLAESKPVVCDNYDDIGWYSIGIYNKNYVLRFVKIEFS